MGEGKRKEGREKEEGTEGREEGEGKKVGSTIVPLLYSTQQYISTRTDNPDSTEILTIDS